MVVFFCNYDPTRVEPDPTEDSEAKETKSSQKDSEAKETKSSKKKKKIQTPGAWFNGVPPPHTGSLNWDALAAHAPELFTSPNLARLSAGIAGMHLQKAPLIRADRAHQAASKKAVAKAEGKLPRSIVRFIGSARDEIRHSLGWAEERPKDGAAAIVQDTLGTEAKHLVVTGVPLYGALEQEPGAQDFGTSHVFAVYDLSSPASVMALIDNIEEGNVAADAVHASIPDTMQKPEDLKTAVDQVVVIASAAAEVEKRTRVTLKVQNISKHIHVTHFYMQLCDAFVPMKV